MQEPCVICGSDEHEFFYGQAARQKDEHENDETRNGSGRETEVKA
jgi:hypothetical protein